MARSYHVLIVDDEEFILTAGTAMLKMLGHTAATAANGEEAVATYKEAGETFDAVIIDLSMPDMDGGECYRALRAIDPDVTAFLTSGYLMDASIRELLDDGMAGMIQKPFTLDSLRMALDDTLISP